MLCFVFLVVCPPHSAWFYGSALFSSLRCSWTSQWCTVWGEIPSPFSSSRKWYSLTSLSHSRARSCLDLMVLSYPMYMWYFGVWVWASWSKYPCNSQIWRCGAVEAFWDGHRSLENCSWESRGASEACTWHGQEPSRDGTWLTRSQSSLEITSW